MYFAASEVLGTTPGRSVPSRRARIKRRCASSSQKASYCAPARITLRLLPGSVPASFAAFSAASLFSSPPFANCTARANISSASDISLSSTPLPPVRLDQPLAEFGSRLLGEVEQEELREDLGDVPGVLPDGSDLFPLLREVAPGHFADRGHGLVVVDELDEGCPVVADGVTVFVEPPEDDIHQRLVRRRLNLDHLSLSAESPIDTARAPLRNRTGNELLKGL